MVALSKLVAPPAPSAGIVGWSGRIALYAVLMEITYRVIQRKLRKLAKSESFRKNFGDDADWEKLKSQGASYGLSTLHAIAVTVLGGLHLVDYIGMDSVRDQMIISASSHSRRNWLEVLLRFPSNTAAIFAAYLCVDIGHVLAMYPKLGGVDTLVHHAIFLLCAVMGLDRQMMGFAFSTLIVGEASTPFLNAIWFLRTLDMRKSALFSNAKLGFAGVFGLTRVLVYGYGLWRQFASVGQMSNELGHKTLVFVTGLMTAGYALNLFWFYKVVRMALAPKKPPAKRSAPKTTKGASDQAREDGKGD
jgi:hypothetical protein